MPQHADAPRHAVPHSAQEWDDRYGESDQLWSGEPNATLVAEVADLPAGRALDVGCGEGGDAIWLARAGWQVTAVDISGLAVERARQAADRAGVTADIQVADLAVDPPARHAFDLVSLHYPSFHRSTVPQVLDALLGAVAHGGTLLVVHHHFGPDAEHHPHFDPADYLAPADVAAALDDTWTVEVDEVRPHVVAPGHHNHDRPDAVLRARRS